MAGYSKTPLVKKLGIKTGFSIKTFNPPANYTTLLSGLPENVRFLKSEVPACVDFIHYFAISVVELLKDLPQLKEQMKQNGMLWISWDKTKSKNAQMVNENIIRDSAKTHHLVDIKVCAVDEVWSGLKLVIRKEHRKT